MMLSGVLWGILGLLLGSFTNVLILRWGVADFVSDRSACSHCKRTLLWYELVPLISYLVLRGKCRTCHARISIQYPLVEAFMGILFVFVGLSSLSLSLKIVSALICMLLVAITVYDLYYTLIPDAWSFSFGILSFVYGVLAYMPGTFSEVVLFVFSGPFLALPLVALWFVSRGTWMGLGDAKLVLGFSWVLGLFSGYLALSLAFVFGALVGVLILLPLPYLINAINTLLITRYATGARAFTMKSEVPFGPFLIAAFLIVWFSDIYNFLLWEHLEPFLLLSSWW